jgi:hypothetical protein
VITDRTIRGIRLKPRPEAPVPVETEFAACGLFPQSDPAAGYRLAARAD